jgi:hypoxanthine-DNA glycosylase
VARLVRSFPPVAARDAEVLILGSMPGEASLAAGRYYAHPQNAFWPVMAALLGFEAQAPYALRLRALKSARIALWDVLHACRRRGSLDADIAREGLEANDFVAFFRTHACIRHVFFNGAKAEECFRRHVAREPGVPWQRLPSTSPAHAALSFDAKLRAWRAVTDSLRRPSAAAARRGDSRRG